MHEHLVIPARHVRTGENVVQLALRVADRDRRHRGHALPRPRGRRRVRLLALRAVGREHGVPLLRPARPQGALHARARGAAGVGGGVERARRRNGRERDDEARRASARPSRSAPISSRSPPGRSRSSTTASDGVAPQPEARMLVRQVAPRARAGRERTRCSRCTGRRSTGSPATSASRSRSRSTTWCWCRSFPTAAWSTPARPSCARSRCCSRSSRPPTDRLRRAQLLFHETSHQWFGDLVTMRWFDDLWLKEGFANFMAAKATRGASLPEYRRLERVPPAQGRGLSHRRDARHDADLAARWRTSPTAKSAYGTIVYSKAPAVLRQAEFYLGRGRVPARGAGRSCTRTRTAPRTGATSSARSRAPRGGSSTPGRTRG